MAQIVGILLPLPFDEPFDYQTEVELKIGQLVEVPFGAQKQIGMVYRLSGSSDIEASKIKKISKVFDFPPLSAKLIKFIEWVAKYNLAKLGMVLKMVISVRAVFEDSPMTVLDKLSGKTLAEAKLKNSDARWRVMDLLTHAPYTRQEISKGANVGQGVIKNLIDSGVLEPIYVENKREFLEPSGDYSKVILNSEQQTAADVLCRKVGAGFSVTLLDGVTGLVFLWDLLPARQQGIEVFLYGVRVQFVQLHSSKIRFDVEAYIVLINFDRARLYALQIGFCPDVQPFTQRHFARLNVCLAINGGHGLGQFLPYFLLRFGVD